MPNKKFLLIGLVSIFFFLSSLYFFSFIDVKQIIFDYKEIIKANPHIFLLSWLLLFLIVVGLIFAYIAKFEKVTGAKNRSKLRIETAKIVIGLSIIVSLAGGFYATQKNIENTREELELNRMDRLTERFFKAVQALSKNGNDGFNERMAGIYTLSEIAIRNSDFTRPVIKVLSNHVMERYPWHEPTLEEIMVLSAFEFEESNFMMDRDIQSILDEIHRIKKYFYYKKQLRNDKGTNGCEKKGEMTGNVISLHLWKADLRGAFLEDNYLQEVWFSGSNLSGSKMRCAKLNRAIFAPYRRPHNDSLRAAILDDVDFENAELRGTRLEGVDLSKTIDLKPDQIKMACIDSKTKFPDNGHSEEFKRIKTERIELLKRGVATECPSNKYIVINFDEPNDHS